MHLFLLSFNYLGAGCVAKSAEPEDLNLQLLWVKEQQSSAIEVGLATLKSLPIISMF